MKNALLLILYICFTQYIYAQQPKGFVAGVLFGLNATQIDGDAMGGFNKLGLRGGFYVQRNLNKKMAYRIEMAYSQKGSKRIYDEFGAVGGIWDKAISDYIEVPLLLKYHAYKKIDALGGISTGYIIRKKVENYTYGEASSDFFRKLESSFIIGVSYPVNSKWSVEARYQQSILSVAKSHFPIYSSYTNFMIHKILSFQLIYKLQQS